MDNYLAVTTLAIQRSPDLHIDALLNELASPEKRGPMINDYIANLLQRMVIGGSSPDCLLYGDPDALKSIELIVKTEGARRWQELRKMLRSKEEPQKKVA